MRYINLRLTYLLTEINLYSVHALHSIGQTVIKKNHKGTSIYDVTQFQQNLTPHVHIRPH